MSSSTSCATDTDCPGNSVCFSFNENPPTGNLSEPSNTSFCHCPRTLLHDAYPDCNQTTSAYHAEFGLHIVELLLLTFVIVSCLVLIRRRIRLRWLCFAGEIDSSHYLGGCLSTFIVILAILASGFHVTSIALLRLCHEPDFSPLVLGDDGTTKECVYFTQTLVCTTFAALFSFLINGFFGLLWDSSVRTINSGVRTGPTMRNRYQGSPEEERERTFLRHTLVGFQVLYSVIMIVGIGLEDPSVTIVATIPYLAIIGLGLFFGGEKLSSSTGSKTGSEDMRRLIRWTTRILSGLTLLMLCLVIAVALIIRKGGGFAYESDSSSPPGMVCFLVIQLLLVMSLVVTVSHLLVFDSITRSEYAKQVELAQQNQVSSTMAAASTLQVASSALGNLSVGGAA